MKQLKLSLGILASLLLFAGSRAGAAVSCSSCAYITGENTIVAWEPTSNTLTPIGPQIGAFDSLVFDKNGNIIVDGNNHLYSYNTTTQQATLLATLGADVADLALEPSGDSVLVSSRDSRQIFRVTLSNGQFAVLYPPSGTTGLRPDGIIYDTNGNLFVCLGQNSIAQLDPQTGKVLNQINNLSTVDGLTFSTTFRKLYAGAQGGFYTVDPANFSAGASFTPVANITVDGVGTSGNFLYLVNYSGNGRQWDLSRNAISATSPQIPLGDDIAPLSGLGSLNPPPTIAFTASPNPITSGSATTLTWNVTNANSASIDQGIGNITLPSGSLSVSPSITTTYTLTATGPGGISTKQVTVTIGTTPPPPPPPAPPVLTSIRVSPQVANLLTGATAQFIATAFDQYGSTMTLGTPFVWTNDLTPINSINSTGRYQAGSSAGSDVVRATNQGVQGSATVTITAVTNPPPPPPNQTPVLTSIRVSPKDSTVGVNLQIQFNATAYDQYGNTMTLGTPFVWTNQNNPANTINSSGLYQAGNSAGTDTVTASNQGIQGMASVTITLTIPTNPPPPSHRHLVISPHHATIHVGDTLPFSTVSVDDHGNSFPVTPTYNVNGAGTISGIGVLTALNTAPTATVTATLANNDPDTATVDILAPGAATDLTDAYAYPVPYKSTQGLPGIIFTKLAPSTKIRIFASNAKEVRGLFSMLGEQVTWDVRNSDGDRVASGVYFYILDNALSHQTKKGKLIIIQ